MAHTNVQHLGLALPDHTGEPGAPQGQQATDQPQPSPTGLPGAQVGEASSGAPQGEAARAVGPNDGPQGQGAGDSNGSPTEAQGVSAAIAEALLQRIEELEARLVARDTPLPPGQASRSFAPYPQPQAPAAERQLFTDADEIERIRAMMATAKDDAKKVVLPDIIPGFQADALELREYHVPRRDQTPFPPQCTPPSFSVIHPFPLFVFVSAAGARGLARFRFLRSRL